MARPKEKISEAFKQKSAAAADKLRTCQAHKLQEDLARMLSEEVLCDLTVQLQGTSLSLHTCVVRARSRSLYDYLVTLSSREHDQLTISLTKYNTPEHIAAIFKALYTADDVTEHLHKLHSILAGTMHDVEEPGIEAHQHDTPTHSSTLKSCTNGLIQNGDETSVYEIAEKIVQKSISEAKLFIQNDCVVNGINENEKTTNGLTTNHKYSVNSIWVSEENGEDITVTNNTGVEHVEDTGVGKSSHLDSVSASGSVCDSVPIFHTVREESECNIEALLEGVYGSGDMFVVCSRLGEDLLRLYLEEEVCDQQFLVHGHTFRGHRCILSARSSYFEAMLGGSWCESVSEQIPLEGLSDSVMKQMMLYLYGGVVELDPACSIGSLMMISDMYAMENLKDIVAFNLNQEYCHFFHRPCSGCIVGVPDTLALTLIYNMDVLKEKCVKWINKNLDRVWPTKTFASLPQEVLQFCVSSSIKELALDNVIDVLIDCRKLNETIPRLRWSEPVFDMIYQLMDAAIEYASQNFVNLVSSKSFRKLNQQGIAFNHQLLEDIFGMMILALSPENACQSYLALNKWVVMVKAQEENDATSLYSKEFWEFVDHLYKKCRDHLCMYIHQAANTAEWNLLSQSQQQELMTEANYVCIDEPKKSRIARPKLTSMQKKISSTSISLREYFDCHFGSKENLPTTAKTSTSKGSRTKLQKGRSPTPTKSTSSVTSRPGVPGNSGGSSLMKKSGQTRTTKQSTLKPALPTDAQSNQTRPKSMQGKDRDMGKLQSTGNSCLKTDRKNGSNSMTTDSSARTKTLLPKSSKPRETFDEHSAANSADEAAGLCVEGICNDSHPEELVEPRARSSSAGAATFMPRFGQRPAMTSAQSMESFFDSRQGQNFSVQRPLPTLTVNFIVPHEFFEAF